uniref:Uncharacterized protein n=1 Tax=Cacopsylla melanoneura TaxID=428564 RepID=A0A8D8W6D5_9HEMI
MCRFLFLLKKFVQSMDRNTDTYDNVRLILKDITNQNELTFCGFELNAGFETYLVILHVTIHHGTYYYLVRMTVPTYLVILVYPTRLPNCNILEYLLTLYSIILILFVLTSS